MDIKLKSGKKIKIKEISLDDRDSMLDCLDMKYGKDDKGEDTSTMKAPHSTITKWLRLSLDGDSSDKFIMSLSMEDRGEVFAELMKHVVVGEDNASD